MSVCSAWVLLLRLYSALSALSLLIMSRPIIPPWSQEPSSLRAALVLSLCGDRPHIGCRWRGLSRCRRQYGIEYPGHRGGIETGGGQELLEQVASGGIAEGPDGNRGA